MIKYYKINQGNTNAALSSIHTSILTSYKTDSIIVAQDTNKIYYHSPKNNTYPVLIGKTDKYVALDGSQLDIQTLQPNTNYILGGSGYDFTLPTPTNNCCLRTGDIIRFYVPNTPAVDLHFANLNTPSGKIAKEVAAYNEFIFRYGGSGTWTPLTASVINGQQTARLNEASTSTYGVVKKTGDVAAFGTYANGTTNIANLLDEQNGYATASSVYNIASGVLKAISADLYTIKEINATILSSHLPSAGLASSTVAGNTWSNTAAWGISQIEGSTSAEVISGSTLPMAASAVYKYLDDQVGTLFDDNDPRKILTTNLPSADTNGNWGITTIEGGYTKAEISGSEYPMAASAVYYYVSANVDSYTTGSLSAVTLDGNKVEATDRVADLGNISVTANGSTYTATSAHNVDLGNNWVRITEGNPTAGYYVQKTETGYKLDPGIATVSAVYNSSSLDANNVLTIDGSNVPYMIKTSAGNFYPIEKGTLSAGANGTFLLDTKPYLVYDGAAGFTGNWTVYYGAGINDVYTTANTVQTVSVPAANNTYSVDFTNGDVAVVTTQGTTSNELTLTLANIPVGHGMIVKVINSAGRPIKFATRTIISSAGTYSFSVFNFGDGAQQVGEVTTVYAAQS